MNLRQLFSDGDRIDIAHGGAEQRDIDRLFRRDRFCFLGTFRVRDLPFGFLAEFANEVGYLSWVFFEI